MPSFDIESVRSIPCVVTCLGDVFTLLGYFEPGDGGGGTFVVRSATEGGEPIVPDYGLVFPTEDTSRVFERTAAADPNESIVDYVSMADLGPELFGGDDRKTPVTEAPTRPEWWGGGLTTYTPAVGATLARVELDAQDRNGDPLEASLGEVEDAGYYSGATTGAFGVLFDAFPFFGEVVFLERTERADWDPAGTGRPDLPRFTVDTAAIQSAFERAARDGSGARHVVVSDGRYYVNRRLALQARTHVALPTDDAEPRATISMLGPVGLKAGSGTISESRRRFPQNLPLFLTPRYADFVGSETFTDEHYLGGPVPALSFRDAGAYVNQLELPGSPPPGFEKDRQVLFRRGRSPYDSVEPFWTGIRTIDEVKPNTPTVGTYTLTFFGDLGPTIPTMDLIVDRVVDCADDGNCPQEIAEALGEAGVPFPPTGEEGAYRVVAVHLKEPTEMALKSDGPFHRPGLPVPIERTTLEWVPSDGGDHVRTPLVADADLGSTVLYVLITEDSGEPPAGEDLPEIEDDAVAEWGRESWLFLLALSPAGSDLSWSDPAGSDPFGIVRFDSLDGSEDAEVAKGAVSGAAVSLYAADDVRVGEVESRGFHSRALVATNSEGLDARVVDYVSPASQFTSATGVRFRALDLQTTTGFVVREVSSKGGGNGDVQFEGAADSAIGGDDDGAYIADTRMTVRLGEEALIGAIVQDTFGATDNMIGTLAVREDATTAPERGTDPVTNLPYSRNGFLLFDTNGEVPEDPPAVTSEVDVLDLWSDVRAVRPYQVGRKIEFRSQTFPFVWESRDVVDGPVDQGPTTVVVNEATAVGGAVHAVTFAGVVRRLTLTGAGLQGARVIVSSGFGTADVTDHLVDNTAVAIRPTLGADVDRALELGTGILSSYCPTAGSGSAGDPSTLIALVLDPDASPSGSLTYEAEVFQVDASAPASDHVAVDSHDVVWNTANDPSGPCSGSAANPAAVYGSIFEPSKTQSLVGLVVRLYDDDTDAPLAIESGEAVVGVRLRPDTTPPTPWTRGAWEVDASTHGDGSWALLPEVAEWVATVYRRGATAADEPHPKGEPIRMAIDQAQASVQCSRLVVKDPASGVTVSPDRIRFTIETVFA